MLIIYFYFKRICEAIILKKQLAQALAQVICSVNICRLESKCCLITSLIYTFLKIIEK